MTLEESYTHAVAKLPKLIRKFRGWYDVATMEDILQDAYLFCERTNRTNIQDEFYNMLRRRKYRETYETRGTVSLDTVVLIDKRALPDDVIDIREQVETAVSPTVRELLTVLHLADKLEYSFVDIPDEV